MQQDNLLYRESKKCSVRDGLHDNFYNLNRKKLQEHLLSQGIVFDPRHSRTVSYSYDPNIGHSDYGDRHDSILKMSRPHEVYYQENALSRPISRTVKEVGKYPYLDPHGRVVQGTQRNKLRTRQEMTANYQVHPNAHTSTYDHRYNGRARLRNVRHYNQSTPDHYDRSEVMNDRAATTQFLVDYVMDHQAISPFSQTTKHCLCGKRTCNSCNGRSSSNYSPYKHYADKCKSGRFGNNHGMHSEDSQCMFC